MLFRSLTACSLALTNGTNSGAKALRYDLFAGLCTAEVVSKTREPFGESRAAETPIEAPGKVDFTASTPSTFATILTDGAEDCLILLNIVLVNFK